jgi:hypothetical protein
MMPGLKIYWRVRDSVRRAIDLCLDAWDWTEPIRSVLLLPFHLLAWIAAISSATARWIIRSGIEACFCVFGLAFICMIVFGFAHVIFYPWLK